MLELSGVLSEEELGSLSVCPSHSPCVPAPVVLLVKLATLMHGQSSVLVQSSLVIPQCLQAAWLTVALRTFCLFCSLMFPRPQLEEQVLFFFLG